MLLHHGKFIEFGIHEFDLCVLWLNNPLVALGGNELFLIIL